MKTTLLLIDFQIDFCDKMGPMYVKGAEKDVDRLCSWLNKYGSKVDNIIASLDTHQRYHISNPLYWIDQNGKHPPGDCTCVITPEDVKNRKWLPYQATEEYVFRYLTDLYNSGGEHRIWAEHCLISSEGHSLQPDLFEELCEWENNPVNIIRYIQKGMNYDTEMFSIVKAQVPDPIDESTKLNKSLLTDIEVSDHIIVAGEASTHCVGESLVDIVNNLADPSRTKNITLLKDATSPIPGLEHLEEKYIKQLKDKGVNISNTSDLVL